ncbi:hypothetical protein [Magnetofaba australis]|uniref:Low-complexity protein n=1 Tax=Magnetofaba australis IT-1 TaxID=1434232 RepID=A0A1Y2K904_9PROT|nr:hypothetical protein [Magnetofaba australis]OSM06977.1 hypothetical protein MAIT1_00127 [Magnetofaba australis IT-1]
MRIKGFVISALAAAGLMAFGAMGSAGAAENPFAIEQADAQQHQMISGGCGSAKCGGEKPKESKCGGEKPKESKCGGEKPKSSACGAAKCGGEKPKESKCGGEKPKPSACGAAKCG